jgi:aspartate kinase
LALAASSIFEVQIEKDLSLLTIRHYTKELIEKLTAGKIVELEQKTTNTIQMLLK